MISEIANTLLTARAAQTQHSVQIAVVKKTHEMEMNLVNMLMESSVALVPEGQGLRVDKQA